MVRREVQSEKGINGQRLDAGKGKQRSWSYVMGQVKGNGLAVLAVVMEC